MPAGGNEFEALPVQARLKSIRSWIEQFLHQKNIGMGDCLKPPIVDDCVAKVGIDGSHNEATGTGHRVVNVPACVDLARPLTVRILGADAQPHQVL